MRRPRGARFTNDFVRKVLLDGRPGTMMPGFSATMSPADIAGIARYVVTLQAPKQVFQKIIVVPHRSADKAYQTVRITTASGSRAAAGGSAPRDTLPGAG